MACDGPSPGATVVISDSGGYDGTRAGPPRSPRSQLSRVRRPSDAWKRTRWPSASAPGALDTRRSTASAGEDIPLCVSDAAATVGDGRKCI